MKYLGPALPVCLVAAAATATMAQSTPPDYGYNWVTVGAPGNQPASPSDFPNLTAPVGAVNYSFRMTRTEITNTQFLPFVAAYVHFHPEALYDPGLSGDTIYPTHNDPQNPGWVIAGGAEKRRGEHVMAVRGNVRELAPERTSLLGRRV